MGGELKLVGGGESLSGVSMQGYRSGVAVGGANPATVTLQA